MFAIRRKHFIFQKLNFFQHRQNSIFTWEQKQPQIDFYHFSNCHRSARAGEKLSLDNWVVFAGVNKWRHKTPTNRMDCRWKRFICKLAAETFWQLRQFKSISPSILSPLETFASNRPPNKHRSLSHRRQNRSKNRLPHHNGCDFKKDFFGARNEAFYEKYLLYLHQIIFQRNMLLNIIILVAI